MFKVFFTRSMSCFLFYKHRNFKFRIQVLQNCRACWGGHFSAGQTCIGGHLQQKFFGRRRRYGHAAMISLYKSMAGANGCRNHLVNLQFIEQKSCANDVENGIDGANFMKMNGIDIHSMDLGFGYSEQLEYIFGNGFGIFGNRCVINDFDDIFKMAMLCMPMCMAVLYRFVCMQMSVLVMMVFVCVFVCMVMCMFVVMPMMMVIMFMIV